MAKQTSLFAFVKPGTILSDPGVRPDPATKSRESGTRHDANEGLDSPLPRPSHTSLERQRPGAARSAKRTRTARSAKRTRTARSAKRTRTDQWVGSLFEDQAEDEDEDSEEDDEEEDESDTDLSGFLAESDEEEDEEEDRMRVRAAAMQQWVEGLRGTELVHPSRRNVRVLDTPELPDEDIESPAPPAPEIRAVRPGRVKIRSAAERPAQPLAETAPPAQAPSAATVERAQAWNLCELERPLGACQALWSVVRTSVRLAPEARWTLCASRQRWGVEAVLESKVLMQASFPLSSPVSQTVCMRLPEELGALEGVESDM